MWSWEFLCRWKHSQACMDQRDCQDFTFLKYEFDGNSSRRLKLTKTLEICSSPKPLWKPWLSFVLVICVFPPAHVPIFCTQLPRDQMLQMLLSSPQQLIWPSRNWGMASSVTEWIDYPVGAPVVSQHVHTQCHWQKKQTKKNILNLLRMLHQQSTGLVLEARSRQASRASHVRPRLAFACGVLMDCSAKPALDAAPFSCTQSRQAFSWFRLLESLSLTSCSVTWALVLTACVLDGALLGKRRKVIAKGMQRLNVQTAPLVCGWAQTGKTQAMEELLSWLERTSGPLQSMVSWCSFGLERLIGTFNCHILNIGDETRHVFLQFGIFVCEWHYGK